MRGHHWWDIGSGPGFPGLGKEMPERAQMAPLETYSDACSAMPVFLATARFLCSPTAKLLTSNEENVECLGKMLHYDGVERST